MGKKLGPFGHTIHEVGIRVRLPIDVGELRQRSGLNIEKKDME